MDWLALGDLAWLCEPGGADACHKLHHVLRLRSLLEDNRIHEITDIVASYESIAVHFGPADGAAVLDWLKSLPDAISETTSESARIIDIPLDYHDHASELNDVARTLGMEPKDVIALHSEAEYQVAAIGFSPGFPYLLGIDPRLFLPRKPSPGSVPAGAVAIAGGQAGIYPCASQGGWHVLGRTRVQLFDPHHTEPSLLKPGDRLRFVATRTRETRTRPTSTALRLEEGIEVIDPGMFSTVQDLGRPGYRASGVTAGGACDPVSARIANWLVGNPDNAAVIECAGSGPVLKFDRSAVVAWLGWMNGSGKPHTFHAGDVLDLRSSMCFSRGVIALSGGIDAPHVLGSRSTDVRAGFGGIAGRTLCANDRIPLFPAPFTPPAPGPWHVGLPRQHSHLEIRCLPGIQSAWFTKESQALFANARYHTTSTSDRTGMRLAGPKLRLAESRELVSQPVVPGSIQIPPDGIPIILLSECQTIGGYPQIGHVISADLPALARALPGTTVSFREVGLDEARQAWMNHQRELALLGVGLTFLS